LNLLVDKSYSRTHACLKISETLCATNALRKHARRQNDR